MYRLRLVIMLLVMLTAFSSVSSARAFTFRLGPLPEAQPAATPAPETDVPTPQFFRVAVDANGLTLGLMPPTVGFGTPEPGLKVQGARPVTPAPAAPQAAETAAERPRLSGVEILLLRNASTVAERPGN